MALDRLLRLAAGAAERGALLHTVAARGTPLLLLAAAAAAAAALSDRSPGESTTADLLTATALAVPAAADTAADTGDDVFVLASLPAGVSGPSAPAPPAPDAEADTSRGNRHRVGLPPGLSTRLKLLLWVWLLLPALT